MRAAPAVFMLIRRMADTSFYITFIMHKLPCCRLQLIIISIPPSVKGFFAFRVFLSIKNYMTSTQSSLAPRAEQMKKNAYRAVTPVLISLAVMIAIVLMLYYFMSVYCVNPILRMNKGLGDYLSFRVPFVVKADCKDEMLELKEKIETLITISKQPKA